MYGIRENTDCLLYIEQISQINKLPVATILIIGFGLHNMTEVFGIAGPLAGQRISWKFVHLAARSARRWPDLPGDSRWHRLPVTADAHFLPGSCRWRNHLCRSRTPWCRQTLQIPGDCHVGIVGWLSAWLRDRSHSDVCRSLILSSYGRGHAHMFPYTSAACSCTETYNLPTISTAMGSPIIAFTALPHAVLQRGS